MASLITVSFRPPRGTRLVMGAVVLYSSRCIAHTGFLLLLCAHPCGLDYEFSLSVFAAAMVSQVVHALVKRAVQVSQVQGAEVFSCGALGYGCARRRYGSVMDLLVCWYAAFAMYSFWFWQARDAWHHGRFGPFWSRQCVPQFLYFFKVVGSPGVALWCCTFGGRCPCSAVAAGLQVVDLPGVVQRQVLMGLSVLNTVDISHSQYFTCR